MLAVQVLLTRWLLMRFGVAPLVLGPPLAIVFGYALLTAAPLPALVAIVQVLSRAAEFSLGKPARETIYTRVDREARYKSKAAIDTVVYRGGDLTFVWLYKPLAALGSRAVFAVGIGVAGAWLLSAWQTVREQRKLPERPPAAD